MHLHGFYFNVDSRGDEREDTVFPAGSSRIWSSPNAGVDQNVHAHMEADAAGQLVVSLPRQPICCLVAPLDGSRRSAAAASHHVENHALEMMAGPVMGITVTGTRPRQPASTPARTPATCGWSRGSTRTEPTQEPAFGYTLEDGKTSTPPAAPYLPGPTHRAEAWRAGQHHSREPACRSRRPCTGTASSWRATTTAWPASPARASGSRRPSRRGRSFEARFTPPRSGNVHLSHAHR